jgi:hypothetical protein
VNRFWVGQRGDPPGSWPKTVLAEPSVKGVDGAELEVPAPSAKVAMNGKLEVAAPSEKEEMDGQLELATVPKVNKGGRNAE